MPSIIYLFTFGQNISRQMFRAGEHFINRRNKMKEYFDDVVTVRK